MKHDPEDNWWIFCLVVAGLCFIAGMIMFVNGWVF